MVNWDYHQVSYQRNIHTHNLWMNSNRLEIIPVCLYIFEYPLVLIVFLLWHKILSATALANTREPLIISFPTMAECIRHEKKSLKYLERDITCAVCQECYTEPKLLPCLHYYCKKCILQLAHRTASQKPFPAKYGTPFRGRDRSMLAIYVCSYRVQFKQTLLHNLVQLLDCPGCYWIHT